MAQDIVLLGATYPAVPAVDLPKSGGGNARFYDRTIPLDYYGIEAELVLDNILPIDATFDETSFDTWTPATTAASMIASVNTTQSIDTANYDYILKWSTEANFVYLEGTTLKAAIIREVIDLYQGIIVRPNSLAYVASETYNANGCVTLFTAPFMDYYNTSGSHTFTWTGSYGVYPAAVAATFSNATSRTPTLTIKRPTINMRCYSSYWSTTMAGKIVKDESTVKCTGKLYRVKRDSSPLFGFYRDLIKRVNE